MVAISWAVIRCKAGAIALAASLGVTLGSYASPAVSAQSGAYPSKAITVINPWTAGGASDAIARPLLQRMSEVIGQSVILENMPGANGTIGAAKAARANPDGYTLFLAHVGPMAISPALQELPYNPIRDFEPITQIVSSPIVLVSRPDLKFTSVNDLLNYARAHPGKLSYGSVGVGSTTHLAGEMLAQLGKVSLLHVPYKGDSQISTDLIGGQIEFAFINIAAAMSLMKDGRVTGLAITTLKRSSVLPELPTVAETLPGFEVNSWYGMVAPKGTPKPIIDKLYTTLHGILMEPETKSRLQSMGLEAEGTTPDDYASKIKQDSERWAKLVKSVGVSLK